jgi:hypothetical protein
MWQTHNFGSHVSVTRGIETTECDRYMTTNLYFLLGYLYVGLYHLVVICRGYTYNSNPVLLSETT